ncbi:trichothecene 3-O-acetyltransferase [Gaeumannomyces tritici R3-111a-1]|uniref:Trichothecene 3-O-acetyltransferase n=1 Tax=Gaeumannomyces tritici (strain R3-111a-1) TaxID=644352 RepID=J3NLB1_GAET3|nr:trichothecene 3-O-acetyltransferase [Gaeumannomyces tritici R3-111a-1]EJT82085.1 trichothecene 3-O-acetyltransferase [Gaeumannomyces tritici R3-111a-1]
MDAAHDDLDVALDILGQQPLLQIYTQFTLVFAVPDESRHEQIVQALSDGLGRAAASFPWIAGQVVNEGAGEGSTGVFKIKKLAPAPLLVVKDLRRDDEVSSMKDFADAGFPMKMLDEKLLAYRMTLPGNIDGPREVLSVQADFIRGGLLLTFTAAHNTVDAVGQAEMMVLISKACRGDNFTADELKIGNMRRDNLVPLLDESYKPGPELADQVLGLGGAPPPPPAAPGPGPAPVCSWVYFDFTAESLAEIKTMASGTIPAGSPVRFVSTDDALSAFVWKSVARARLPRLLSEAASTDALEVKLTRAIDVRPHLDLPPTYPGLMQTLNYHRHDLRRLAEAPLGVLAADLRAPLLPPSPRASSSSADDAQPAWDLARLARAIMTYVAQTPDLSGVSFTATVDPASDLMLSSWAKLGPALYGLDFGLGLGMPVAVRRPRFNPFEGLAYLMPRAPDGGIALAVSLRDEDLERLRADVDFAKFAVFVG